MYTGNNFLKLNINDSINTSLHLSTGSDSSVVNQLIDCKTDKMLGHSALLKSDSANIVNGALNKGLRG